MKQEYVKCHVPMGVEAWSSATAGSTSAKFRELLTQALAEKREPQALPKEVDKIAIDLATEINALTARMDELRSQELIADGVAPGRIAGMLVQAQLNRSAKANATTPQPQAQQKTGLWPDQLKLHDEFMGLAKQGAIAAVEAGTGTGKSRIIGACAHSLVALRNEAHAFPTNNNQAAQTRLPAFITDKVATWHETEQRLQTTEGQKPPVVIAAPTIANLLHLLREFKSLDLPGATYALLIGRQQFASAQAIAELLQEHPCPPVEAWLQAGMPCGQSSNTVGIGVNGLMDDLRTVASGLTFPCEDACLNAQSDEEESAEYNRLRTEAAAADIIFTTHAMVAMRTLSLARGNTPQIAKPYAILIDEAHMVEDSFASMSGSSLAMSKLGQGLKPDAWEGSGLKGKVQACRDSWSSAYMALQALPEECPLPMQPSLGKSYKQWLTAKSKLKALNEELTEFCNAASKKSKASQNVNLSYLMSCKRTLDMMLDDYSGRIEFSPSRRFPLVQMGVKSVTASLLYTWESANVVGLFSGTLFTTNETIDGAINSLAMDLAVPRARTYITSRVHPSWLFDSATLYLPKPGSAPKVPKSPDIDEGSVNIWAEQTAQKIQEITQTAKGGTLVLCTGYERAHAIANELRKLLADTSVLVEQKPSSGVDGMARQFRAIAAGGKRPIAIATGGSWTGLDLSDSQVSPEKDTLLTDLIISAIPFNTQRSYLHLQKVQRLGMNVEISYALRKFTQGLGRLIRRPGVKDRRLWILDNRLESVRSATYSSRFLSALARYTRKSYY